MHSRTGICLWKHVTTTELMLKAQRHTLVKKVPLIDKKEAAVSLPSMRQAPIFILGSTAATAAVSPGKITTVKARSLCCRDIASPCCQACRGTSCEALSPICWSLHGKSAKARHAYCNEQQVYVDIRHSRLLVPYISRRETAPKTPHLLFLYPQDRKKRPKITGWACQGPVAQAYDTRCDM